MREEANKEDLFHFLSEKIASSHFDDNKELFGTGVAVGTESGLLPCNHEEASTRIVIHEGKEILIHTVDTDVIVILLGKFHFFISL